MKDHEKKDIDRLIVDLKEMKRMPDITVEATGLYRCELSNYTFWLGKEGYKYLENSLSLEGYDIRDKKK